MYVSSGPLLVWKSLHTYQKFVSIPFSECAQQQFAQIILMGMSLQVGDCRTLHVLSMRENELTELPASLGQLEELTVLDVVGNR